MRLLLVVLCGLSVSLGLSAAHADEQFEVSPTAMLRLRLGHDSSEGVTRFTVPQVRLGLEAKMKKVFRSEVTISADNFSLELLEAWISVRAYKKHLQVQTGYFKRPFARERLTPAAWVGGVNRTLIRKRFNQGRDLGLMLHNGLRRRKGFEWAIGFFADFDVDDIDPELGIANLRPTLAARVGWHSAKADGYRETDRHGGALRGGVGLATVVYFEDGRDTPGARGLRWTADGILKAYGLTVAAAAFGRTPALSDPTHSLGAHAHVGYRFQMQSEFELVMRYGGFFEHNASDRHEVTTGLNVYLFGDYFRVRVDGSWLRRPAGDGWRARLQVGARY